jgi:hypothetical protein
MTNGLCNEEIFLSTLFVLILLAFADIAEPQQQTKTPRIGYLSASSASEASPRTEAFRQGLREVGYIENKNLVIEWRYAEGKFDRLPALAADLVRLGSPRNRNVRSHHARHKAGGILNEEHC